MADPAVLNGLGGQNDSEKSHELQPNRLAYLCGLTGFDVFYFWVGHLW